MGRRFLMILLGVGALAGFGAGFARLYHHGYGWGPGGGRYAHHRDFERRVADTCADAALRVYKAQSPASPKP